MSSDPRSARLAWKLWQSCDVIKAPSVQPAFVYFFWCTQPILLTLGKVPLRKAGWLTWVERLWAQIPVLDKDFFLLTSPLKSTCTWFLITTGWTWELWRVEIIFQVADLPPSWKKLQKLIFANWFSALNKSLTTWAACYSKLYTKAICIVVGLT